MDAHKANVGVAFGTLLASTGTLVCCVLPAVLVSAGAGATLVSLVSAFPQLVWLSEHKILVFAVAAVMLLAGGVLLRRARRLPCPLQPDAARSCLRLRRVSAILYAVAVACFVAGATVALLLPALGA